MFKRFEPLPRRESELTECFYCGSFLPAESNEHIFNSFWGGSCKTNNLICAECNNSFSGQTDLAFAVYVQAVMNAWEFKGESRPKQRREVPKIFLNDKYYLEAGAQLKLRKPLIEKERLPDGRFQLNLTFNSKNQAKHWLDQNIDTWLERASSTTEKDAFRKLVIAAQPNVSDAKPQLKLTELNLREQYRSTAHTVLKCLGLYAPEWVQENSTRLIREFARYNRGDWRNFAVETEQLFSLSEQLVSIRELGVHHNSVEVYWDSSTKMIIGVLNVLNRIKRSVVLANSYSGPDSVLYILEETHPSKKPPNSVFVEFDKNQFSLPLLSIQYFASYRKAFQYFYDEINVLTQFTYPRDAIMSCLIKSIETKNRINQRIDQTSLKEYIELFLDFFLDLGKAYRVNIDPERVYSELLKHGFGNIQKQHSEKSFTDPTVESLMASALKETLKYFNTGSLSR